LSKPTQAPCFTEVTSEIEGIPTVSSEFPECWTGIECGSPALTCDGIQYDEVMSFLRRQLNQELKAIVRKQVVLTGPIQAHSARVTSGRCSEHRRIELSRPGSRHINVYVQRI